MILQTSAMSTQCPHRLSHRLSPLTQFTISGKWTDLIFKPDLHSTASVLVFVPEQHTGSLPIVPFCDASLMEGRGAEAISHSRDVDPSRFSLFLFFSFLQPVKSAESTREGFRKSASLASIVRGGRDEGAD